MTTMSSGRTGRRVISAPGDRGCQRHRADGWRSVEVLIPDPPSGKPKGGGTTFEEGHRRARGGCRRLRPDPVAGRAQPANDRPWSPLSVVRCRGRGGRASTCPARASCGELPDGASDACSQRARSAGGRFLKTAVPTPPSGSHGSANGARRRTSEARKSSASAMAAAMPTRCSRI